ncbi:MAG: hypothetical protein H3C30_16055 [Candidatus Hydrogenedentes bacterium]|nr:hypothetical protein [Candidatus Hydrogenedentota bacterium]
MNVIGVDPAGKTGYAYRTRDGWKCGAVSAFNLHALLAVFSEAASAGVTDACVEDCYLGLNVSTLKALANIQGRVCGALEAVGIAVRLVQPRSWKSAMLQAGGIPVAGRESQKAKGMEVARRLGASPATDDESDAVCIAEYGATTGMQTMFPTGPAPRRAQAPPRA